MTIKYDLDPSLVVLTIHLILIVALADGSRKNARFNWLYFIPIAGISIHTLFFSASKGATSSRVTAAYIIATALFIASDYILLRNHQSELRQIGQKKPTSEMLFLERLAWAIQLALTPRGIGWSHEPTSHLAPKPRGSRIHFIVSQLLWIGLYFLASDLTSIFIRTNPCFTKGGPPLAQSGWSGRSAPWLYIVLAYESLSMVYASMSVVSVAMGITEPKDWPHLFGSPLDAYTLQNCWGRFWHQLLRKIFTAHANALVKILRLPKCIFTTYVKLFASFFISGLLHCIGDYAFLQYWTWDSLRFFVLQAVAIAFENTIITTFKRLGYTPGPLVRLIGFCWVFAWFTYTFPPWMDALLRIGNAENGSGVSLIMGVWKGDWTPKRL